MNNRLKEYKSNLSSSYVSLSKNDFYSFLIIIPLIIIYEFLGFINNYQSPLIIKNGADVYIRHFFQFLGGEYANIAYSFFLILLMALIFFKNKNLFLSSDINLVFLFMMIAESLIHSLSLLVFLSVLSDLLPLAILSNNMFEKIYLSIGAGIWEELLFRYIFILWSIIIFNKIFKKKSRIHYLIAIIFSSSMFSYYHFIGVEGDPFNLSVFIYRFIAGIALSIIFIFRGLGIAVYTHTFYDLYLVIFGSQ